VAAMDDYDNNQFTLKWFKWKNTFL
jgi:hypothetical protein